MNKLKVGQTVWLEENNNGRRYSAEAIEVTVKSVGSKYFTLDGYPTHRRFHKDTLKEKCDIGYFARVWLSLQDIADEREYREIAQRLSKTFNYLTWNTGRLTLAKLRQIEAIINGAES